MNKEVYLMMSPAVEKLIKRYEREREELIKRIGDDPELINLMKKYNNQTVRLIELNNYDIEKIKKVFNVGHDGFGFDCVHFPSL